MRMKKSDPRIATLESDFLQVFGSALSFTHFEIGVIGFSDGSPGAQWNAWYNLDTGRAFCGVNLEGISSPGWPLTTFLERERSRPTVFCAIERVRDPARVELRLWRDVWIAGVKHRSESDELKPTTISAAALTGNGWSRALRSAWKCTNTEAGGRGFGHQDIVLLRSKKPKALAQVSPHLQFKTLLWDVAPGSKAARVRALTEARSLLAPIHQFVDRRSR